MNTKMLFEAIRNCEDDARPIRLEVRTPNGVYSEVLSGVAFDRNGIYLCAGELPDESESKQERRTVKPLPSSPYVGPNGEFYPWGGRCQ